MDCLPKYGPYTASEDEIHLFDSIRNKKVLILMWKWAFAEIYGGTWRRGSMGPGSSSEQIKTANETLKYWNPTLICGAMEEEGDIPKDYFDIVYSIYALGWTSDLRKTLELIYSYVKPGGSFVLAGSIPYIQT